MVWLTSAASTGSELAMRAPMALGGGKRMKGMPAPRVTASQMIRIQAPKIAVINNWSAVLAARLAGHDLRPHIRAERMVTPTDWEAMGIHLGATFNLAHNLGQMLHRRPRNRFEDLDRVYLTGGGTHPGSGLPTIFESARIASKLVAQDIGLDARAVPESAMREAAE